MLEKKDISSLIAKEDFPYFFEKCMAQESETEILIEASVLIKSVQGAYHHYLYDATKKLYLPPVSDERDPKDKIDIILGSFIEYRFGDINYSIDSVEKNHTPIPEVFSLCIHASLY